MLSLLYKNIFKINLELWNKVVLLVKHSIMAADKYESVKIKKSIVNKVRANKKKTGVNVCTFFEQAAEEKLLTQKEKQYVFYENDNHPMNSKVKPKS